MLHYTKHAKDRMKQRGIAEWEVEECVNSPDATYPSEDEECKNYVRTFPIGRKIRVVLNEKRPNHKIVVTTIEGK